MRRGTDIPLGTHIKEARRAIVMLLEREHRSEQNKTDQEAQAWLAKNRKLYAGQWIALRGAELLAAGKNARDVYALVREQQPVPLVVKIESDELPSAGF
jgi:hypothetical protein